MICLKRAYDPAELEDGRRFLVERLWPRGMKKDRLLMDAWVRDVAPSDALRRWFAHDPKKWEEFQRRYFAELDRKPEAWQRLLEAARQGTITLLYSARDSKHNNAVVLRAYLEKKLSVTRSRGR